MRYNDNDSAVTVKTRQLRAKIGGIGVVAILLFVGWVFWPERRSEDEECLVPVNSEVHGQGSGFSRPRSFENMVDREGVPSTNATQGAISVFLTDAVGDPVHGKAVFLRSGGGGSWDGSEQETDKQGNVIFSPLEVGSYIVGAKAVASKRIAVSRDEVATIRLREYSARRVTVRVVEEGGGAVEDAVVSILSTLQQSESPWRHFSGSGLPSEAGRTNAQGEFLLQQSDTGTIVQASKAGYVPSLAATMRSHGELTPKGGLMTLRLRRSTCRLLGRVTGSDARPISGAIVLIGTTVEFSRGTTGRFARTAYPLRHITDAEGMFESTSIAPGKVLVSVYAQAASMVSRRIEIEEGETCNLEVELEEPTSIRGRIELSDGRPCGKATIRMSGGGIFLPWPIELSEQGEFYVSNAPVGPAQARVSGVARDSGLGTVPFGLQIHVLAEEGWLLETVALKPQEENRWMGRLRPRARIFGKVVTEEGIGVAKCRIWARSSHMSEEHEIKQFDQAESIEATTSADGEFVLVAEDRCPVDLLFYLDSEMDELPIRQIRNRREEDGLLTIVVHAEDLERGGLQGRAVFALGKTVSGQLELECKATGTSVAAVLGIDGEFVKEWLPVGDYVLRHRDGLGEAVEVVGCKVRSGITTQLGDVFVSSGKEHGSISLWRGGIPLRAEEPSMSAKLLVEGIPWIGRLEERDGVAGFWDVPAGKYSVQIDLGVGQRIETSVTIRPGIEERIDLLRSK